MKKQITIILTLFAFISCSTPVLKEKCKEVGSEGNIGLLVNTVDNEPLVKVVEDELVYLSNDLKQYDIFQIKNNKSLLTKLDNIVKFNNIASPGLLTCLEIDDEKKLYVVSGLTKDSNNRDLFAFIYVRDEYARKVDMSSVNGPGFDGHPFFVRNKLYFTKEVQGQWDIFAADYHNNQWTNIKPIDNLNTRADEGFYSESGNKSFFSRRKEGKFNIFSTINNDGELWNPYQLNNKYNTDYNDISPLLVQNSLYLSSDRPGGCGEFDIYRFEFCGKVKLNGSVTSEFENIPLKGTVELYSEDSVLINQCVIPKNAFFEFDLIANKFYYLTYKNDCYNTIKSTNLFFAECNEISAVVIQQDIILPNYNVEFNFEEYDIPFFVTGYYRPNTTDNLKELKRLFNLGVITGKGNTSYIQYPDDKYHDYSKTIDSAFNDAINYINERLDNLNNQCVKTNTKIVLDITGYSDPRDIAPNKVYPGPDIYDGNGNVAVKHGATIDNQLLSFIRAYYTGAYLKEKVSNNENVIINMLTGGIDNSKDRPNDLKRRVKVSIRLESAIE